MESRTFDSFGEASAFAKSLAQEGVIHNLTRSGSSWLVEHEESGVSGSSKDSDIERLIRRIDEKDCEIERMKEQATRVHRELRSKVQALEERAVVLQQKLDPLEAHIEDEVAERTKDEQRILENTKSELSEKLVQAKRNEENLNAQKHRLDLLEKEYAKHFGEAEVKSLKEKVTSKEICPRCGGDGGIKGGCRKCDGHGWIDVTEEKLREVVEIK